VCSARFPEFLFPETKGWVSSLPVLASPNLADDVVQTLEETDAAFGSKVTDSEREHKECIYRDLGLPVNAPLTA
jgi:hypothetical protein